MVSVRTSIFGDLDPLHRHQPSHRLYTLIREEPYIRAAITLVLPPPSDMDIDESG